MGLQCLLRGKGAADGPKMPHLQHSPATDRHEIVLGDADDFPLDDFLVKNAGIICRKIRNP